MPMIRITSAVLAAVVLASGCGGESFADRDPKGYEACGKWAAAKSRGDVTSIVGGNLEVAELARESSTKAIRASVENLMDEESAGDVGQFGMIDAKTFEKACKDEGFDIG